MSARRRGRYASTKAYTVVPAFARLSEGRPKTISRIFGSRWVMSAKTVLDGWLRVGGQL